MKKIVFLALVFSAIVGTKANAQTAGGPSTQPQQQTKDQTKETDAATMLKQTKEKIRPLMVEKTGLTEAQADKVIEILFEMRQTAATTLQGLSDADRSKKLAELKDAKDKKFHEFLTEEQITAVKTFYEDLGKNSQPKN